MSGKSVSWRQPEHRASELEAPPMLEGPTTALDHGMAAERERLAEANVAEIRQQRGADQARELEALSRSGTVRRGGDGRGISGEAPTLGVGFRSDGGGSAHDGWDRDTLGKAGLNTATVPAQAGEVDFPGPRPKMPDKVKGQSKVDRRLVVAENERQVSEWKGDVDTAMSGVTGAREDDDVSTTMDGIDGLYLAGAPMGVHSELDPYGTGKTHRDDVGRIDHDSRADHEHQMLAQARTRGMPVMGVCAGSWRVLEAYGGHTTTLPQDELATHYRPGAETWDTQHEVDSRPNTLLGGTFPVHRPLTIEELDDDDQPTGLGHEVRERNHHIDAVNSTHWATAATDEDGELASHYPATVGIESARQSQKLPSSPDELEISARGPGGSVEGFESRHGAPVMGVQWHPEGYAPGAPGREGADPGAVEQSDELFKGFGQAMGAYKGRKAMNAEFEAVYGNASRDQDD